MQISQHKFRINLIYTIKFFFDEKYTFKSKNNIKYTRSFVSKDGGWGSLVSLSLGIRS